MKTTMSRSRNKNIVIKLKSTYLDIEFHKDGCCNNLGYREEKTVIKLICICKF